MKVPYKYLLLGPIALYYLGAAMNILVVAMNHGQMPVLLPPGCVVETFQGDVLHTCMRHASHLKFLADWISLRDTGVASPGDLLIWLGDALRLPALWMWIALVVKDANAPF